MNRTTRTFVQHYLEMLVAMAAGMLILNPLLTPLLNLAVDPSSNRTEADTLTMATSMAITMAAWMRYRGHGIRPIAEMSLAMYAGFLVLFPFLWAGQLTADGVMMGGHVLMLLFMLGAMLARAGECSTKHRHARTRQPAMPTGSND